MGSRAAVLELAILGQLRDSAMHGYELRKQLNAALGRFRTLSYGSLYPALKALQKRGLITAVDTAALPHALAGQRSRIVYQLTNNGHEYLAESLNTVHSQAWDDENFDVRFSLFADIDPPTRLRILEGRRTRMIERRDGIRDNMGEARLRTDSYTAELHRHALDQVDREIRWLEDLITAERRPKDPTTTAGPADTGAANPTHGQPTASHATGIPSGSATSQGAPRVDSPMEPTTPTLDADSQH